MRKSLAFSLLAATLVLAGCDGGTPTDPEITRPSRNLPPPDVDGECCIGGGGGDGSTGGGTTTTTPQFRISTGLVPEALGPYYYKYRAHTRFEKLVNGSWQRYDTSNVSVACYVSQDGWLPGSAGTYLRDSETENNASEVDITFDMATSTGLTPYIDCVHSANSGAYTATTRNYISYLP